MKRCERHHLEYTTICPLCLVEEEKLAAMARKKALQPLPKIYDVLIVVMLIGLLCLILKGANVL